MTIQTIQELQTFADTKPEVRWIIEELIKYIQANPGGYGTSQTLQQVLDAGTVLDKYNTIDGGGYHLTLVNVSRFSVNAEGGRGSLGFNTDYAQLSANINNYIEIDATGEAPVFNLSKAGVINEIATVNMLSLQQVLDAGAVLNKSNTIDGGGHSLILNNLSEIDILCGNYSAATLDINGGNDILNIFIQDISNSNNTALQFTPTGVLIHKVVAGVATGYNEIATVNMLPRSADNYADDTAAATGGIVVGGLYHTAGAVKIRLA